nr:MAG TPA: hypothetical protein [Bacteriophage sp.]
MLLLVLKDVQPLDLLSIYTNYRNHYFLQLFY